MRIPIAWSAGDTAGPASGRPGSGAPAKSAVTIRDAPRAAGHGDAEVMTQFTHAKAPIQGAGAGETHFAYRRFGTRVPFTDVFPARHGHPG